MCRQKTRRRRPVASKHFWLGAVYHEALNRAQIYTDVWAELVDNDTEGWTPEFEQEAERRLRGAERFAVLVSEEAAKRIATTLDDADQVRRMANRASPFVTTDPIVSRVLPPMPVARTPDAVRSDTQAIAMLCFALNEYVKAMKAKALSPSYKARLAETVEDLKFYRADMPLTEVERIWLEQLTEFIEGRPKTRRRNARTRKFEPLAPATVKAQLQHWRQAFDWIDRASDSDRFGWWEAPKRMSDLFSVDLSKIRTKAERARE